MTSGVPETSTLPGLADKGKLLWTGLAFFLITIALLAAFDSRPMDFLSHTDSLCLFYTAGTLVREGNAQALYPPLGFDAYFQAPFNLRAHALLPALEPNALALFLYPPPVALICVPFSLLPPAAAMICWQAAMLISYLASAVVFAWRRAATVSALRAFLSIFTLLLALHDFLLGKPTALLTFLPLVAGYMLWRADRCLLAGLVWSLLFLKTQFLVPVGAILLALSINAVAARDKPAPARRQAAAITAGISCGLLAMIAISAWCLGWGSLVNWFNCVKLFTHEFVGRSADYRYILSGSLPSALNVLVPAQYLPVYADICQAATGVLWLCLCLIIARVLAGRLPPEVKKDLSLILALGALPLISPYLRIGDLVVLSLPLWIYLYHPLPPPVTLHLRRFLVFCWSSLNLYILVCTWAPGSRYLLVAVMLVMTALYARMCGAVWRAGAS